MKIYTPSFRGDYSEVAPIPAELKRTVFFRWA